MTSEFHRGDVICRIGDTKTFIVLDSQEPASKLFSARRYSVMEVADEDWCRTITYNHLFQDTTDMTYVKVGRWDFEKNQEVDDDVQ